MKIENKMNNIISINSAKTKQIQENQKAEESHKKQVDVDVKISQHSKELFDEERIKEIKNKIDNQEFKVNSNVVAENMIKHFYSLL